MRSTVEVERPDVEVDAGRQLEAGRPVTGRPAADGEAPLLDAERPEPGRLRGHLRLDAARGRADPAGAAPHRPRARPRVGGRRLLLGERPALQPEPVAVETNGDVEAGLQLLAQRPEERVALGQRQREVDGLDVEADRRLRRRARRAGRTCRSSGGRRRARRTPSPCPRADRTTAMARSTLPSVEVPARAHRRG